MTWLRALMLLSLIVWIGGIIFFAFVLAPTVFAVLPTTKLAGDVVSSALTRLHWLGFIFGVLFLVCSLLYNRQKHARAKPFAASHILVLLMLLLTGFSQFRITPRMRVLRMQFDQVNVQRWKDDSAQIEFKSLHKLSTWTEGTVLLLGMVVVALTARRFENRY